MAEPFKIALDDAIFNLPDDFYCDDCKPKVATPGFKMCNVCGSKPVPEHLKTKMRNYFLQKIRMVRNKSYG